MGGLIVFVTGVGPWDVPPQERRLPELMAKAEAMGLPMTQEDLKPNPPITDEENAAPELIEIGRQIQPLDTPLKPEAVVDGRVSLDRAAMMIEAEAAHLDQIKEVLKSRQKWYVERDWDRYPELDEPFYGDLKAAVYLLSTRAWFAALSGDSESAISDLAACTKLAELIASERHAFSSLTARAYDSIALEAAHFCALEWSDDPGKLILILELLDDSQWTFDYRRALETQFYTSMSLVRNLNRYLVDVDSTDSLGVGRGAAYRDNSIPVRRSGAPKKLTHQAYMSHTIDNWIKVFEAFGEGPLITDEAVDKSGQLGFVLSGEQKLSGLYSNVLLPELSGSKTGQDWRLVKRDMLRSLVSVLIFRSEEGRIPASLEEIGIQKIDLFDDGRPLKAKLTEDEIRIWSFGPDRKDDGGSNLSGGYDIFYAWPLTHYIPEKESGVE